MRKPVRYRSHESHHSLGEPCKGRVRPGRQSAAGEANGSCYPNKRKCRTAHGGDRQNKPHGSSIPWGFGSVRFYASHSALCFSHHAGKAGSFGERVGRILGLIKEVSSSALKGEITNVSELTPKYRSFNNASLSKYISFSVPSLYPLVGGNKNLLLALGYVPLPGTG